MRRLIVSEFVSLNGIMQSPGGEPGHPDSGWAFEYHGPELVAFKLEEVLEAESLLIGRVTYEGFAEAWPPREGEFADKMNAMPKHVVSSTLPDALEWNNSTVLRGDVADEVSRLKAGDGGPILVAGSMTLVHTLFERDLVDEYRLLVCPIVVADGKRMWPDVAAARRLRLADTTVFPTGAVVHTLTRS